MSIKYINIFCNVKSTLIKESILSNIFYLFLIQLISYALPFLTLPYVTRVVGAEMFGIIAFSSAFILYFNFIVDFGFNYTAVREIAKNKNDITKVSKIFCNIMTARLFLLIIAFVLIFLLTNIFDIFNEHKSIIYFSSLSIVGIYFLPEWFFQGIEKMKYIAIFSFLSKLIFTILVFLFINQKEDYILYPLFQSIGSFFSGLLSIYFILKKYKLKIIIPPTLAIFNTLKQSFNMFISVFLPNFYNNISIIFLTNFSGNSNAGIFEAGNRFIVLSHQLSTVLNRAFYPFLARKIDKHNIFVIFNLIFSIFLSLTLFFSAELIVKYFLTSEFKDSALVIKYMSITPLLFFLNTTYGTGYLSLINKEKELRNIVAGCSIIGFFLSLILIKNYGFIGACLTLIIIRGLMGVITLIYALYIKHHKI